MTNDQLTLQVNKINISTENDRLKYDQSERGKALDVTVIDNDGTTPYDLTGKTITFVDLKDGNTIVLDDEASGGQFIRTADNDKLGKFTYVFQEKVYQRSGMASFEFRTDSNHIDVSTKFEIEIDARSGLSPSNDSYISQVVTAENHLNALVDSAKGAINQYIGETANAKKQADEYANQVKAQISKFGDQFTQIDKDWELKKQSIQDQANKQLSDIEKSEQSKIQDAISKLQSDADATAKTLQGKADADSQSVQAAIAKVKSDTADAINKVNADKEAALKKASDDFASQRTSLQSDYSSWKSGLVTDLNAQLKAITDQITTDKTNADGIHKDVTDLQKEIDQCKKDFDKIDFDKYVTNDEFQQFTLKKASGLKITGLGGELVMAVDPKDQNINGTANATTADGVASLSVLTGVLQTFSDAILDKNHYTKDESYSKQQVDSLMKTATDAIDDIKKSLASKADQSSVTNNTNRISALETADFKPHQCSTEEEALKYSAEHHCFAYAPDNN